MWCRIRRIFFSKEAFNLMGRADRLDFIVGILSYFFILGLAALLSSIFFADALEYVLVIGMLLTSVNFFFLIIKRIRDSGQSKYFYSLSSIVVIFLGYYFDNWHKYIDIIWFEKFVECIAMLWGLGVLGFLVFKKGVPYLEPEVSGSISSKLIKQSVKRLFTFTGRASCAEYWHLLFFSGGLLLTARVFMLMFGTDEIILGFILTILWTMLLPAAVSIRRFHDFNLSGWWYLFFTGLNVLCNFEIFKQGLSQTLFALTGRYVFNGVVDPETYLFAQVLGVIIGLPFFILFVWPGQNHENKYGEVPRI